MALNASYWVGLWVWELFLEIQEKRAQLPCLQIKDVYIAAGHANKNVPMIEWLVCELSGSVHVSRVLSLLNWYPDLHY